MLTIVSFLFVIGVLVFIHELGHYLAARSVGVRVEKFYIGMNLFGWGWKKVINDTEYGIGWFPLGGYVKVAGIIDESMDTSTSGAPDEFRTQPTWAKIWIMSAGVIMNFLLSIIILTGLTFTHGIGEADESAIVGEVVENYPAESIGIQSGDSILSINENQIETWNEMTYHIYQNPSTRILVEWSHDGITLSDSVTTESSQQYVDGELTTIGIIGISPLIHIHEATILESFQNGIYRTGTWIKMLLDTILYLLQGKMSINEMAGPVMIAKIAGETASIGMSALLGLMAFLSVNLGLINILPIPGLDGGHVLIALIEGVIRRELSLKIKMGIQQVGLLFLIILFITIMVNDIARLF